MENDKYFASDKNETSFIPNPYRHPSTVQQSLQSLLDDNFVPSFPQ